MFGLLYVLLVRHDRRVTAFAAVMIGTAVWTLGYSFQFASADIAGKRLWAMVSMAGEAVVPAAWCTFALVYARRGEWLTRPRLAALWTVPALTVSRVEAGRVTGRLVVVRDVTDRIRLERRFRRLIEASFDIVFVLNEGGDIEYASPSVERVLGYDPDALVGRLSFEDLIVE
ncbi:MAG: hypothetical protein BRD23_04550, partial [Halobacteriales archaeon SW_9_67_25]